MLCEQFEERWQQLLDRRRSPQCDEALRQHAHTCEACHQLLEISSQTFGSLNFAHDHEPSDEFVNKVVSQVVHKPTSRFTQKRVGRDWLVMVATSAAALLLVFSSQRFTKQSSDPLASKQSPHAPIASAQKVDAPEVMLAQNNFNFDSTAVVEPATPVPTDLMAQPFAMTSPFPSFPKSLNLEELRETISLAAFNPREPVNEITSSFRPITASLQSAVDVLWRSLPGGKETRPTMMKQSPDTTAVLPTNWTA